MADDIDDKADLAKLNKREDFPEWKEPMKLMCWGKGGVEGIFTDDGSDPQLSASKRYRQTRSLVVETGCFYRAS